MRAKRVLIALACFLMLGAGAIFGAGQYLSQPVRHSTGVPPPELFATAVTFPANGDIVAGWVARGAGSGAVLLLHGVRADRRQMQERALFLNRSGYSVLLIDLPAHGESTGKRITFGANEAHAVRAAIAYLSRNLPGERIGVIGASLGAAALVLSKPGDSIGALVIEAMYPAIEEAVNLGPAGRLLSPLLLRAGANALDLQPINAMSRITAPVLVIGGERDRHTTPAATRRIFEAAPGLKQLWMVEGAAHVDFHGHARAEYERRVGAFLAQHLRRGGKLVANATSGRTSEALPDSLGSHTK